jgi:hypothetical protein
MMFVTCLSFFWESQWNSLDSGVWESDWSQAFQEARW